eukprot:scaffold5463_cov155-Skeletonema_marinoi.AAC.17
MEEHGTDDGSPTEELGVICADLVAWTMVSPLVISLVVMIPTLLRLISNTALSMSMLNGDHIVIPLSPSSF